MDDEEMALLCYKFRQALQADLEEDQIAYLIQNIHRECNRDHDAYKELWPHLSSLERSAIKKYLDMPHLRLFMDPSCR